MIDCNKCEYINITEKEQIETFNRTGMGIPQVCEKFDRSLFNQNLNEPDIKPCAECEGKCFKERS